MLTRTAIYEGTIHAGKEDGLFRRVRGIGSSGGEPHGDEAVCAAAVQALARLA